MEQFLGQDVQWNETQEMSPNTLRHKNKHFRFVHKFTCLLMGLPSYFKLLICVDEDEKNTPDQHLTLNKSDNSLSRSCNKDTTKIHVLGQTLSTIHDVTVSYSFHLKTKKPVDLTQEFTNKMREMRKGNVYHFERSPNNFKYKRVEKKK